ncbi:MAG: D-alanine--D-alanine ligase [Bryobacteraceae bacterium]|nr:D-alanine--D-alanine ligase [Bryobacteraceae bacterium]
MKTNIAVLYGGRSGEHEVSLRSAESVMNALNPERYSLLKFFINKEGRWSPRAIQPEPGRHPEIDVVFPVLHGTFGEDGTLQGLLELADLPYVGPGVLASAASMDKEFAKRLLLQSDVPVVEYIVVNSPEEADKNPFGYPVFVKPVNLGSSVGISKAKSLEELRQAIATAREYDTRVLVERSIAGMELECAVLGNSENAAASVPCQIVPSREFYDYEDKYLLNLSTVNLPAPLTEEQTHTLREMAVRAYNALLCEGMSRVDFLLEQSTGKLYVNEVNTIPGFTSISMYPKMWEYSGMSYPELLDRLIELALARHARKRSLRFSR